MIKANKICSRCRKIKNISCICPEKKPFENISKDNYPFYNSTQWRKVSKGYRKRHPLCKHCEEAGRVTPSAVVDHIKPIDKGGDKWNSSNLQALCHKCHNKKSAKSK